jgi:outer membrane receptor protein involved in Fe transport
MVRYDYPVADGLSVFAQVNDHYTGAEHPYLADPTTFGDGHSLGARMGIRNDARRWEASLWGANLTDTRPLTYAYAGSQGQQVSYYQKPRSLGVEINYRF